MQDVGHLTSEVAWLAFALAVVFGAVANRSNFCTMGAITDAYVAGDWRRMRMWLLAIAVAIVGATALERTGSVDLSKSIYTAARVPWLSHVVGGLLFGFGMTLASGCGSKTLIRLGSGNLKSLVVLIVLGISAYMTLKGLFAVWRVNALDVARFDTSGLGAKHSDLASVATALLGNGELMGIALPLAIAAIFVIWALGSRDFRASPEMIVGGVVVRRGDRRRLVRHRTYRASGRRSAHAGGSLPRHQFRQA